MPAFYVLGQTNSSVPHAWVGWIERQGRKFVVRQCGRYKGDHLFMGRLTDPCTGQPIQEFEVGLLAQALSDRDGYERAEICHRIWTELGKNLPAFARLRLLRQALEQNPGYAPAWRAIAAAAEAGEVPPGTVAKLWDLLQQTFKDFPDFQCSLLEPFSRACPGDAGRSWLGATFRRHFCERGRPDLAVRLYLQEFDGHLAEGRKTQAVQLALEGIRACAGEGAQGKELAERLVELLRELRRLPEAVAPLRHALSRLPIYRAMRINAYWVEMMEMLRDVYLDLGDARSASEIQSKLDRQYRNLAGHHK